MGKPNSDDRSMTPVLNNKPSNDTSPEDVIAGLAKSVDELNRTVGRFVVAVERMLASNESAKRRAAIDRGGREVSEDDMEAVRRRLCRR